MLSLLEAMLNANLLDTSATLIMSCKSGVVVGRGDLLPECLARHHMQGEESHAGRNATCLTDISPMTMYRHALCRSILVSCPRLNRKERALGGSDGCVDCRIRWMRNSFP